MMTDQLLIILSLCIPVATMIFIFITHNKINIREAGILISSVLLIFVSTALLQRVLAGAKQKLLLLEFLTGLAIHFKVETLGMMLACIGSFLWLIN